MGPNQDVSSLRGVFEPGLEECIHVHVINVQHVTITRNLRACIRFVIFMDKMQQPLIMPFNELSLMCSIFIIHIGLANKNVGA